MREFVRLGMEPGSEDLGPRANALVKSIPGICGLAGCSIVFSIPVAIAAIKSIGNSSMSVLVFVRLNRPLLLVLSSCKTERRTVATPGSASFSLAMLGRLASILLRLLLLSFVPLLSFLKEN